MILRRLGNKKKIAKEIQKYFPDHKIYIEPFFGAGGMFFNKPKAKYNIVNDIDSDVFNLFQVVSNQKEKLVKEFIKMPMHRDLLEYWKENKETQPIKKALRFLFLSNLTYMGKQDTLHFRARKNEKDLVVNYAAKTLEYLGDVKFNNKCFRDFIKNISFCDTDFGKPSGERAYTFIYADPPYLGMVSTYEGDSWDETDTNDLFDVLIETDCKFAISEFDNPIILELAERHKLNVITIGERQNLKNRRTEILITNYEKRQMELF